MYDRYNDQRAGQSAPTIVRFRLTEALTPTGLADAHVLRWSINDDDFIVLDGTNMTIEVKDPFEQASMAIGAEGWAIWQTDARRWEILGMASSVSIGKTDGPANAGTSQTVSIYAGTPGSETDTTENITSVFNRTSVNIGSNAWVRVEYINGHPYMEPWQC